MSRSVITCYFFFMLVSKSVQVAPFRTSLWKSTEQQPCRSGKYATITTRNTTKCRYCSVCPKGQQVETECGTHSDTVCVDCPSGSFNDVRGRTCRQCSRCKPGMYIRRYCSLTHDTKCRPCPKHRFNTVWNTEACENCRRCKAHEKFIAKCQKNRDTQCGECLLGYFRESFTGNCLPCSPCPYVDLRRYVVNECQTRMGIENSNVCWPGVFENKQIETRTSDIVEPDEEDKRLTGYQLPDTKIIAEDSLELAVDDTDLKKDEFFQTSMTLITVAGATTLIIIGIVILVHVYMRRIRNGDTNTTESGSFTYEDHHQDVNDYSNIVPINDIKLPDTYLTPINLLIQKTGNTCTYVSDYSLSSTTVQSSSELDQNISDVFCKSESAPTVLKSENEPNVSVSFTKVPCLLEKKKKSKRRKKRTPPADVIYYNIPCNPQYFPKQLYVTL